MEYIELPPHAPPEIQQKAARMNACRDEIEDLRSRLRAAESVWNTLKDEVKEFIQKAEPKSAVATAPVKASLSRLPAELLYNIFQMLKFEHNSHLGALLLVNKHIHHFVMTTPLLWTRIELHIENDLMARTLPRRSFVEACIQRSQNAGLDVEIKVEWDTTEEFLKQAARDGIMGLVDDEDDDEVWNMFEGINMDFSCSIYEEKCFAMLELLDAIVGTNGCHMYRWKSLIIELPNYHSQVTSIAQRLVGDTPGLRDLEIRTNYEPGADVWDPVLPNLSGLRRFRGNCRLFWASSNLNPMLEELEIHPETSSDFTILSSYQALQHLVIHWAGINLPRNQIIHLPNLRTLHIEGSFHSVLQYLLIPPLYTFSVSSYSLRLDCPLPTAAVVEWSIYGGTDGDGIIGLLQAIFSGLRGTQKLCLYHWSLSKELQKAIRALKISSSSSEELQTVVLRQYRDAPGPPVLELGRSDLLAVV